MQASVFDASPIPKPLAERLRPKKLNDFVGQNHLIADDAVIGKIIQTKNLPSIIFWGPPGVGKTTLAKLIGKLLNRPFFSLSAIQSGVKEVRQVIDKAKKQSGSILFLDEIHRFNKSQQDALLGAVETGIITLIGATTENPSFEVIAALLSRCQVYILKPLEKLELIQLLKKAIKEDEILSKKEVLLEETEALLNFSGGDARKLLNILEIVVQAIESNEVIITDTLVQRVLQQKTVLYDKNGEQHYDIISAFIKSIRGSDPNAAVYWLARMVEGGEDVKFIARRLVILAAEDIGLANPTALALATNCFEAVNMIGYPEAEIILAEATVYLASSPKSNASYMALRNAKKMVQQFGDLTVPKHLRNSPTKLMKELDYGKGYQYSHDFENNFSNQEYLPEEIKGTTLYEPSNNQREIEFRKRLKFLWKEKYGY